MAFTSTLIQDAVYGNNRVRVFSVAADAASGTIVTGLNYVQFATVTCVSAATAGFKVKRNLNDSSAAAGGTVFVSSAANGDVFILVAHGG